MKKAWHNFRRLIASRRGQTVFNILYSWGAAVVILGAMFKIMHIQGGNEVLMIGMIVEVIVFIAAGFDYTSPSGNEVGANALSGVIISGANYDDNSSSDIKTTGNGKSGSSTAASGVSGSSVVVVGGSSSGGGTSFPGSTSSGGGVVQSGGGSGQGGTTTVVGNAGGIPSSPASGGSYAATSSGGQSSTVRTGAPDYGQSVSDTAQNLEEFSTTIQSLNEASQKLLKAYNQITETNGFVDNITTLNQNVSGLNDVFNAQLQTITEQMSAIRYINDSLSRMKNLYDGAIGDSYMFREESAKMTKHIEALNNVYARLLQAMTTNNNPNQPKF
ncbi:gliding motility protein GldL [Dysgonomonas sp. 521]|uniref:type IX secretion system motor protein PorL/GldL n=1 Tax=Dysgonomonas sp. 521 TaxID=2302932 RepID=UPI0013D28FC7|nr:gliding motility protein GldL [Dysgonomonas sp. 521]NDV94197.1 gliding motility protein GldL [Dysgonomonas sp. 521]